MKVLLIIVAVLVVLIAIVLAIGASLPRKHVASRSVVLRASSADAYALVRDFAGAPNWRSDVKRVELLDAAGGHPRFREHAGHDAVTYEVLEDVPGRKLVTRIVDENLGYSGSWTYDFASEGNGARVRITENGEVSNVFFRFMMRFVFGETMTIDKTLRALAAKLGGGALER